MWSLEFNNFLRPGEPNIFALAGGRQISVYESTTSKKLQEIMCYEDPDVRTINLLWYFIFLIVFHLRWISAQRGFLHVLLVGECVASAIGAVDSRRAWHHPNFGATACKCQTEPFDWPRCCSESAQGIATKAVSVGIGQQRPFGSTVEHRNECMHRFISCRSGASRWSGVDWFQPRLYTARVRRPRPHDRHLGFDRSRCCRNHRKK